MAKKYPETPEQLAKLSLDEVNAEINRLRLAYEDARTVEDRRTLFDRLVWVEAERERLHMIPAKPRVFSAQLRARPVRTPAPLEPEEGEPDEDELDADDFA